MVESLTTSAVEAIGADLFETIGTNFPVAAASDEFYYFPQVQTGEGRWQIWDHFSESAVNAAVTDLQAGLARLDKLSCESTGEASIDPDAAIEVSLMRKVTRTLIEQLTEVRAWQTQPTWHLTIACIGIAEALESNVSDAGRHRAAGLAGFLDRAGRALKDVPVLFRDLGLEMVAGTRDYFLLLERRLPELKPALTALDRFEETLHQLPLRDSYLLPRQLVERIITSHLNCGRDTAAIEGLLDGEIREVRRAIETITGETATARGLAAAISALPPPPVGPGGLLQLYREEVDRLGRHCLEKGLVPSALYRSCPVRVLPVPAFLSATRTASSYSIPPGSPPAGGVFYVINAGRAGESAKGYQREYQILASHESYPGHHLLDAHRWSLKSRVRRAVEQPVFYEGWACFAEEMMRETGYFKSVGDHLLMARRRLWRAMRGKVDLGLQTGRMPFPEAVRLLAETGMPAEDAMSAARKYPLNPGYQLCYTAGIRRFLDLYKTYGQNDLPRFTRTVLGQGEIDFADLEQVLAEDTRR